MAKTKTPAKTKFKGRADAAPPQKTLVTFLLDRSGSMASIRDTAIASFNGLVSELKASVADIRLSLVLFDTAPEGGMALDKVCVGQRIADVPDLTAETYTPRGMTPLCDAIAATIGAVSESMKGRQARVVLAIQTDGMENASREHNWASVRALIEAKTKEGWEFKFLGAGLESRAYEQSGQLGLSRGATVSYNKGSRLASVQAFAATGANIRAFAEGAALSTDYSPAQKHAAGDAEEAPRARKGNMAGMGDLGDYLRRHGAAPAADPAEIARRWVADPIGTPVPGWGAPRPPVATTGPAVSLTAKDFPAVAAPAVQGLGNDPRLGVAGTPPAHLSSRITEPFAGGPFVLDAFGVDEEVR